MDVKKYISSGILELYVAGVLTEEQNMEVHQYTVQHPEIKEEVLSIEASILELSKSVSPNIPKKKGFNDLKIRLGERKIVKIKKEKTHWGAYAGWAAAIVFAIGSLWFYKESSQLKSDIDMVDKQNEFLQQQMVEARNSLTKTQNLLGVLRDQNIKVITLNGQKVSPTSYAKVYWNNEEKKVFIDAQGLPEPPDGMVYQAWSLKLKPLTYTSMGLLENFDSENSTLFVLPNPNESEAFGITLEPAGGSESPTLKQLYTLGAISAF